MGEQSKTAEKWVMVPMEPTPEMIAAMAMVECTATCINRFNDGTEEEVPILGMAGSEEAYAAMLGAASPYPKGVVVGPCVCGGWPGGECLQCPRTAAAPKAEPAQRATLSKKDLNKLLNDFAQACAFGDDVLARMAASKAIHEYLDAAFSALAAQQAPAQPPAKVVREGLTEADLPMHPEPHNHTWSALEKRCILAWANSLLGIPATGGEGASNG